MKPLWLSLHWPCLQLDCAQYVAGEFPLSLEQPACSQQPDATTYAKQVVTPLQQLHEPQRAYLADPRQEFPIDTASTRVQHRLPVVLLDEKTMQVVEMDRLAAAAGVHRGMSLALSCALVADLQVLPYQAAHSQQLCLQLAEALHSVCADLYLGPKHTLLLRLDPMLQLHQGLTGCLEAIRRVLAPLNLRCDAGLATTWLQAQLAQQPVQTQPAAATTPTKAKAKQPTGKPSSTARHHCDIRSLQPFCALPQHSLTTLRIALTETPLAAKWVEQLQRLGISHLHDLLALPRAELTRRFGQEVLHFLQQLQQTGAAGLSPFLPSEKFDVQLEFVWQPTLWTHLIRPLTTLLQQLESFLRKRQWQAHRLDVQLQLQEHADVTLHIHAAAGEYLQQAWLKLVSQKLESLVLPAGVRRIRLQALQLQARQQHTQVLWQEHKTASATQTSGQLLALLQARLGSDAIKQPQSRLGHHIELDLHTQFNWTALEWQASPQPQRPTTPLEATTSVLPARWTCRPLFLHTTPLPLPLGCRKMGSIERLCSPWWHGHVEPRDYFLAQSPSWQWLWCFKDAQGQYFSHGGFA